MILSAWKLAVNWEQIIEAIQDGGRTNTKPERTKLNGQPGFAFRIRLNSVVLDYGTFFHVITDS
jgi:hypothetical protein